MRNHRFEEFDRALKGIGLTAEKAGDGMRTINGTHAIARKSVSVQG
jgi:hypothetical protein